MVSDDLREGNGKGVIRVMEGGSKTTQKGWKTRNLIRVVYNMPVEKKL